VLYMGVVLAHPTCGARSGLISHLLANGVSSPGRYDNRSNRKVCLGLGALEGQFSRCGVCGGHHPRANVRWGVWERILVGLGAHALWREGRGGNYGVVWHRDLSRKQPVLSTSGYRVRGKLDGAT
jgi:hypothetical protein